MIDIATFAQTLNGRPVAVFGLGISNVAAIAALHKAGVTTASWDDKPENRAAAEKAGAVLRDLAAEDMSAYAALVLAPGVPLHFPEPHPVVKKAREAGIEIICDIEILARSKPARPIVAVTGTNGKSTTTALIGHILNTAGAGAAVGGNIGTAALALDVPAKGGAFVLEISSYQMDLCPTFAPDIAVHMNFSPDHIDRHGDMKGYVAAKRAMFRGAGKGVIGIDDEWSVKMAEDIARAGDRHINHVAVTRTVERGAYVEGGKLYDAIDGGAPVEVADLSIPTLPGAHNHQNAAAAYAACRLLGLEPAAILEAMKTFPGLPHRQFLIRVINGVPYINDSKATNADATARALACYKSIFWILGGKAKEGGLKGLEPYMDRVRGAFLIGDAAEEFAAWLKKHNVEHQMCGTLDRAVRAAHDAAQAARGEPGGIGAVLLSPACASFDQFRNFEERGEMFAQYVNNLPEGDA